MNEEQKKKFEEWAHKENFLKKFDGFSPTLTDLAMTAENAWQACLETNKVEEISNQPWLGNATTKEMLEELMARAEVHGYANYRTVDGGVSEKLEVEQEPTPTEMARKLLEKGWEILCSGRKNRSISFIEPNSPINNEFLYLKDAYIKAFPRKKKVEVEVWLDSDGCVRVIPPNSDSKGLDPKRVSWGWTKGTATFWVEDSDE